MRDDRPHPRLSRADRLYLKVQVPIGVLLTLLLAWIGGA